VPYSIDTSYFVRAWSVWYPFDVFPGFWQVMVSAAVNGQIFVVEPVRAEMEKQIPDLVKLFDRHAVNWSRDVSSDHSLRVELDSLEVDLVAGRVIRSYPLPNIVKYMQVADPVLVLHAQLYDHVVVSNEVSDRGTKKGPKIPDLCATRNVRHASPQEFAATLGYVFRSEAVP
jgi:hypothetical protein